MCSKFSCLRFSSIHGPMNGLEYIKKSLESSAQSLNVILYISFTKYKFVYWLIPKLCAHRLIFSLWYISHEYPFSSKAFFIFIACSLFERRRSAVQLLFVSIFLKWQLSFLYCISIGTHSLPVLWATRCKKRVTWKINIEKSEVLRPVSLTVFALAVQIRQKFRLALKSRFTKQSLKRFCTCHDSCAVVVCTKYCSDLIASNGIASRCFHRIRIAIKKC